MTLKPNYVRGFLAAWGFFFLIVLALSSASWFLARGHGDWPETLATAVHGGAFLGFGVCVMFTPREIKWDNDRIRLRVIFPKSGDYNWQQLQAYSPWGGRFSTFLLKFEGMQSYQIVPVCFRIEDWKAFQSFLRTQFPRKRDLDLVWSDTDPNKKEMTICANHPPLPMPGKRHVINQRRPSGLPGF